MRKAEANKKAEALVERLGSGWKPVVWENFGWHCKAVSCDGRFKIHYNERTDMYDSFLSLDDGPGGDMDLTDDFSNTDPRKVVNHQIEVLREHIRKYQKLEHDILVEIRLS